MDLLGDIPVHGPASLDNRVMLSQQAELACSAVREDVERFADHPVSTGVLAQTNRYIVIEPWELGFTSPVRLMAIKQAANEKGYLPCPFELAFEARELYVDQPEGEVLIVMTDDIEVEGHPQVFTLVTRDGYSFIDVCYGDTGDGEPYELIEVNARLLFQLSPEQIA